MSFWMRSESQESKLTANDFLARLNREIGKIKL
jgi:hypothetical protein